MKRLQSLFFLLLCFALGVGLALAYIHLRAASKAVEVPGIGTGNAPPLRGFSVPSSVNGDLLEAYPPLHATAVAFTYAEAGRGLAALVARAHQLKLQVVLLPPPTLSAENPYPHPLTDIAAEARAAGVDVLCISWLDTDPDPDYWKAQLTAVRAAFSGRILLAAQPDLLPGIEFLDQTDLVGAIGPFDLGLRRPTTAHAIVLHDLRTAWANYLDSLESLCFRYGKQLVLLNITTNTGPTAGMQGRPDIIPLIYEALLTETKGRLGTGGLFLNWDPAAPPNAPSADAGFINHYPDILSQIGDLWTPAIPSAVTPPPATAKDDADDADSEPQ
jgi:hypothetical protein